MKKIEKKKENKSTFLPNVGCHLLWANKPRKRAKKTSNTNVSLSRFHTFEVKTKFLMFISFSTDLLWQTLMSKRIRKNSNWKKHFWEILQIFFFSTFHNGNLIFDTDNLKSATIINHHVRLTFYCCQRISIKLKILNRIIENKSKLSFAKI